MPTPPYAVNQQVSLTSDVFDGCVATIANAMSDTLWLVAQIDPAICPDLVGGRVTVGLSEPTRLLVAEADVIDARRTEGGVRLTVSRPQIVTALQRRAAVRAPVELPAEVTGTSHFSAVVADLSTGGCRLRAAVQAGVALGEALKIATHLDDGPITLRAEVRRLVRHEKSVEIGCRFTDVDARTDLRLSRAVFATQRRSLGARNRGDAQGARHGQNMHVRRTRGTGRPEGGVSSGRSAGGRDTRGRRAW
jgi:hypothetical protein